jgi:hypothetical protein
MEVAVTATPLSNTVIANVACADGIQATALTVSAIAVRIFLFITACPLKNLSLHFPKQGVCQKKWFI